MIAHEIFLILEQQIATPVDELPASFVALVRLVETDPIDDFAAEFGHRVKKIVDERRVRADCISANRSFTQFTIRLGNGNTDLFMSIARGESW